MGRRQTTEAKLTSNFRSTFTRSSRAPAARPPGLDEEVDVAYLPRPFAGYALADGLRQVPARGERLPRRLGM